MTAEEPGRCEQFEKALLIAYIEAAKADPTTTLLGTSGIFSHVLIEPADSPFAAWLIERQIAVLTAGGEVALPYGGSHLQISVGCGSFGMRSQQSWTAG